MEQDIDELKEYIKRLERSVDANAFIIGERDKYIKQLQNELTKNNIQMPWPTPAIFARPHLIHCPICGNKMKEGE